MDAIKDVFRTVTDTMKKHISLFICIPLAILICLFLTTVCAPLLFGFKLIILELILTALPIIFYIALYSGIEDDRKKHQMILVIKIDLIVFLLCLCLCPFLYLGKKTSSGMIVSAGFVFGFLAVLLAIVFMSGESGKKIFENLEKGVLAGPKTVIKDCKPGDVVLCKVKEEVEAGAKDPREIIPYKDRFLHMLILGATGTGKTSQILLPMIRQDIQNPDIGVIVLEPKGDLAQKVMMMSSYYGRPAKYFDPSMDDCPHFNPMAGREIDVVENMATTFRMLNPDSPTFFQDLSEQLIRNSVKVLKRLDKACGIDGKYANLIKLGQILQNSGGEGRRIINEFNNIVSRTESEAGENRDIASWFLNDYYPERSKVYENTSGIRSQVAKICSNEFLRSVLNPDVEHGEKNDVDFDAALLNGEVICISTAQGVLRDLSRFLGYFIILQLQSAVFRRPGNEDTRRACMLYIDEFQTYSTPGFSDMLTQGRSYRVASHLATQARSQMEMGGGRDGKDFVNLVSTNARNVVIFPGCSYDDAKFYSNQFGEIEKIEIQTGTSRKKFDLLTGGMDKLGHPTETTHESKKMSARFSPTDIIYREFGEITYCIIKNNSVQTPKIGVVSYIPKDLNDELDRRIAEYVKEHKRKTEDEIYEEKKTEASGGFLWGEDGDFELEPMDLAEGEELEYEPEPDKTPAEPPKAAVRGSPYVFEGFDFGTDETEMSEEEEPEEEPEKPESNNWMMTDIMAGEEEEDEDDILE